MSENQTARITLEGQLEISSPQGTIYFHEKGRTRLRIQGLPIPIPNPVAPDNPHNGGMLDVNLAASRASWDADPAATASPLAREGGDSFHVDYIIGWVEDVGSDVEQENVTHAAESPDEEVLAEKEFHEFGWVLSLDDGGRVQILAGPDEEGHGWNVDQRITAQTADQLGDAFKRIAELAREREAQKHLADAGEEAKHDYQNPKLL